MRRIFDFYRKPPAVGQRMVLLPLQPGTDDVPAEEEFGSETGPEWGWFCLEDGEEVPALKCEVHVVLYDGHHAKELRGRDGGDKTMKTQMVLSIGGDYAASGDESWLRSEYAGRPEARLHTQQEWDAMCEKHRPSPDCFDSDMAKIDHDARRREALDTGKRLSHACCQCGVGLWGPERDNAGRPYCRDCFRRAFTAI